MYILFSADEKQREQEKVRLEKAFSESDRRLENMITGMYHPMSRDLAVNWKLMRYVIFTDWRNRQGVLFYKSFFFFLFINFIFEPQKNNFSQKRIKNLPGVHTLSSCKFFFHFVQKNKTFVFWVNSANFP